MSYYEERILDKKKWNIKIFFEKIQPNQRKEK